MLRIILTEDNDLPVGGPVLAAGLDSAATAIRAELSTQAGEWPFDLEFGMRWRGVVLTKFFDAGATAALLASTINRVPDIDPVSPAQITIDTATAAEARQANITIDDVTVDDEQDELTFVAVL